MLPRFRLTGLVAFQVKLSAQGHLTKYHLDLTYFEGKKKNRVYPLIDRKCVKTLQQHPLLSTKEKSFLFFPVQCSVFFLVIISKYNKHVGQFLHSYPSYISSILHLYRIFHYFNYFVFQTRNQKVIHVFLTWLLYVQFII